MIKYDGVTGKNKTKHKPNQSYIPDHQYRILIIGVCRTGKQMQYLI